MGYCDNLGVPKAQLLTLTVMALFPPRHPPASGNIEPGSSGHMRPGHGKAYPSSPPPPHSGTSLELEPL
jgi:hypothetical protein